MATAPKIAFVDGSGFTQNLSLTTNQESIILTGTVDANTADIQISVNGGGFISDPGLVLFSLPNFTIPNLSVFPTGLILQPGVNTILIRTIDIFGAISPPSSAVITQVSSADSNPLEIPSGIKVRRLLDSVDILAANPVLHLPFAQQISLSGNFLGFNFYASTSPGGTTGYFKINESLVTASSNITTQTSTPFQTEDTIWENLNQQNVRVKVTEEDVFGHTLAIKLEQLYDVRSFSNSLRFQSTLSDYYVTPYVKFNHVRAGGSGTINSDQFINVDDTKPLYYVVTAVYYDTTNNRQIESPYSQEVLGQPLIIDTGIRDLPGRNQGDIQVSFIQAIRLANKEISLLPGSTTRDVSIDPFSSEAERLYFILDFVHRSGSFLTLLQIDDVNGDGISDPVATSSYKTALKAALGLTTDLAVQNLIDQQFDKLAGNLNTTRLPGRAAVGQVVFYTSTTPQFDIPIPAGTIVSSQADAALGIPSVRFRVGGTFVMTAANAQAFYNFDTKRYEITVDVTAETIGQNGNRPAGQITQATGVSGLQVTNTEATVLGTDKESNTDLATRAELALVSVDTGTQGGYARTTAGQLGIIKSKVIKSGDELMMRDYDPVRAKHIGGKVDIWVQGTLERQVKETFAFTFATARNITATIITLSPLTLRVQDSRVTPSTPIIQVLDNLSQGLGVRNVTSGLNYDLTGVVIVDYQTIRINDSIPQPPTGIDDIITVDYRFRAVDDFFLTFQPVRRIVSVVGEVSGPLDSVLGYSLFKTEDPLLNGESTIAKNFVAINQVAGVPSGNTLAVNAEEHVLIGFQEEPLLSVGINTATIRVFNSLRTIEYQGPSGAAPDFEIIAGTPTTPARIVRTSATTIPNGAQVSVDYVHDENFVVTYVINDLLQQLQSVINLNRHTTADVIVKQAIQNQVDLETTVQLARGGTKEKTDPVIRSSVSQVLNQKLIGQGIAQANVIQAIDSSQGVDYPVVPLALMAYADGSLKLREGVLSDNTELSSLNIGGNIAYILNNSLEFPTTDGGGLETEHKGVFQDDVALTLSPTLALVASAPNQAIIIGSEGAIITGYTDTPTLVAAGFVTAATQAAELLRRTANHIVVSLSDISLSNVPTNHVYTVSYVIRGDVHSHDITASAVEFIDEGKFTITYRDASVT